MVVPCPRAVGAGFIAAREDQSTAALFIGGQVIALGVVGGKSSAAADINNTGQSVAA